MSLARRALCRIFGHQRYYEYVADRVSCQRCGRVLQTTSERVNQ